MFLLGDCLVELKKLPDASVDAVITDPPYELGFMGKGWDKTGIANNVSMWRECFRVLKPGSHLLSFGGTRTYHRMASAIEDAGFEIRDMIEWVYGSGFPKSLNIGKAVDTMQGNERIDAGEYKRPDGSNPRKNVEAKSIWGNADGNDQRLTKGTSEWEGWGTALKPAHEPIVFARKPLEGTVAENVLKHGVGGINVDGSRVGTGTGEKKEYIPNDKNNIYGKNMGGGEWDNSQGRFPANLIHDGSDEVKDCFPDTKGKIGSNGYWGFQDKKGWNKNDVPYYSESHNNQVSDSGNASRFFKSIIYTAKASKGERNAGLEELPLKISGGMAGTQDKFLKTGSGNERNNLNQNNHPTVKPVALMEYLINMVTKEGQTVLDPFAGSGTTGIACVKLNRKFILIEKEPEYMEIAKRRIASVNVQLNLTP